MCVKFSRSPITSINLELDKARVVFSHLGWINKMHDDDVSIGIRGLSTSLYRTTEWNQPVDATVEIIDSGNPELDGSLSDALEIIGKLATSERVEKSL